MQFRISPDGGVDERASSHNGYNYDAGRRQLGLGRRLGPLKDVAETVGARPAERLGPGDRGLLLVSGGSHAGNAGGCPTSTTTSPAAAST